MHRIQPINVPRGRLIHHLARLRGSSRRTHLPRQRGRAELRTSLGVHWNLHCRSLRRTVVAVKGAALTTLAALTLLVATSVGCSSAARDTQNRTQALATGTVTGTLQLVGGPAPGAAQPVPGVVYAFTSGDLTGQASASTPASSNGRFNLSLRPGTYFLAATSPRFSIEPAPTAPPCRAEAAVRVTTGTTVDADVLCQLK